MLSVVLAGYSTETGLGEGPVLGRMSSWEADARNQGKTVSWAVVTENSPEITVRGSRSPYQDAYK